MLQTTNSHLSSHTTKDNSCLLSFNRFHLTNRRKTFYTYRITSHNDSTSLLFTYGILQCFSSCLLLTCPLFQMLFVAFLTILNLVNLLLEIVIREQSATLKFLLIRRITLICLSRIRQSCFISSQFLTNTLSFLLLSLLLSDFTDSVFYTSIALLNNLFCLCLGAVENLLTTLF